MEPTFKIYCPSSDKCQGHTKTAAQIAEEETAMRPFTMEAPVPSNRFHDPERPMCFRERDEWRARGQWPRTR